MVLMGVEPRNMNSSLEILQNNWFEGEKESWNFFFSQKSNTHHCGISFSDSVASTLIFQE
jgi:hypothetical protein